MNSFSIILFTISIMNTGYQQIQLFFSVIVALLLIRLLFLIERIDINLGNLIRVIFGLFFHLQSFGLFFIAQFSVFAVVGRFLFFEAKEFSSWANTLIYLFNASLANFEYSFFEEINMKNSGRFYVVLYLIVSFIMLLNMLIALLANVYTQFS